MSFPPLPPPLSVTPWPPYVHRACSNLQSIYDSAARALQSETEGNRLTFHLETIERDAIPVLFALQDTRDFGVPLFSEWVLNLARAFERLRVRLEESQSEANGRCVYLAFLTLILAAHSTFFCREQKNIAFPNMVEITRSGKPGRPKKAINKAFLDNAMSTSRRIHQTQIAVGVGVHRNTVRKYLKEYNINYQYSNISDDNLDAIVHEFRERNPQHGLRFLMSYISRHRLRIQKQRLRDSVQRVDPVSNILRSRATTRRRQYKVTRPNALWHLDGHHKLIRWGIVIHGLVDGYCRTVR